MILTRPAGAVPGQARTWAWGISLLAHGAALAWLVHAMPPQRFRAGDARLEVRFVLVRPVAPPAPAPKPPEPVVAPRHATAAASSASAAAPARAARKPRPEAPAPQPIAMPEGAPEPAFTVAAPPQADHGHGFDMAAARGAARAAVSGPGGIGAGRAQPLRETRDEKLGRAIDGARNGDCQTQYAGMGIMALIPLAKDTLTGSGCKWK